MAEPITWDEIARRFAAGEPLEHLVDERSAAERERVRAVLAGMGPRASHALKDYDAALRDYDTGLYGARMCWHSISPAQRRTLLFLAPGRVLVRSARVRGHYDAVGTSAAVDTIAKAARLDTARNLASRGLLDWDGGALDPEGRAVPSDRGRFVLAHGRGGARDASAAR